MAHQGLRISRSTDKTVITFFEKMREQYGFENIEVRLIGLDSTLRIDTTEIQSVKKAAKYTVREVVAQKSNGNGNITFQRNKHQENAFAPDWIEFHNNGNTFPAESAIKITEAITDTFYGKGAASLDILGNTEAFTTVIASHQEIIGRLEKSLEQISEKFTQERLKIQSEQDAFIRKKTEEFSQQEINLHSEISKEREALTAREKDLDNRTNMHARRGIRADMKNRLKEHAANFTLTEKTRRLRWPIHGATLLVASALTGAIIYYTVQYDAVTQQILGNIFDPYRSSKIEVPPNLLYPPLIKVSLLSIAVIGILTWYIRWMNRWFDQHAQAEFNLKQFELDIDRASWVVETAMEWKSSQHGLLPSHLLENISRNLFALRDQKEDENLHAADHLASAILGSAAKAKLSVGDSEIELDRKGIKALKRQEG